MSYAFLLYQKVKMKFNIFLIFALMAIVGCISKGRVDIQLMNSSKRSLLNASIATVQVSNNQLIINGTNLKNALAPKSLDT